MLISQKRVNEATYTHYVVGNNGFNCLERSKSRQHIRSVVMKKTFDLIYPLDNFVQ